MRLLKAIDLHDKPRSSARRQRHFDALQPCVDHVQFSLDDGDGNVKLATVFAQLRRSYGKTGTCKRRSIRFVTVMLLWV